MAVQGIIEQHIDEPPIMAALRFYHGSSSELQQYINLHLLCGRIVNTPELFMLFRAVDIFDPMSPWEKWFPIENPNCWFIWIAATRQGLDKLFEQLPYPLPYLAWERHSNKFKVFNYDRMKRRIYGKLN